ncbi:non-ribosomal peptide synthetase [Nocardia terpenica]|uniref:non-ribosomal peptide synthetase n=1 Tax=Nocardia terpenica TaxID=455432 RepID=UPI0018948635|nr:non-ribosomal peptide synthetase [Nocardia terpenica]MBF6059238.1 non-ribosomal peptide synthetase [Nocardia terpenica]MBF6103223.1 non-ribosomal peptide synthetase [Nocardia terpenica]MBF6110588.1 non-ribosomal peptide synthetase [Nocardia terpenica]MBF6116719.1 non-ribosomal peptide synthetase [Nocardia terpenica]
MSSKTAALVDLITGHATTTPDALAVSDGETFLTYRELVTAAARLAAALRAEGVRPGQAVGLLVPHSVRAVVAQLAVWWAGSHYVPLDPAYPAPRLATMTADAALVLGDADLLADTAIPSVRAMALAESDDAYPDPVAPAPLAPDAIAYVLYTSGSTGEPKPVAIPHRAVAALSAQPEYVTVTARDRVLFHSPMTFDASMFEVWTPLANGAAVVTSTADRHSLDGLAADVQRLGATVAVFTTSLFHHLAARRSPIFDVLRTVLVGGEQLSAQHARTVLHHRPWLELVNGYGPTEATTFATAHRVRESDCAGPPPIGRPIQDATAIVLDEHGTPLPPGEHGELWLGGPRLALGYLGRPDLTADRFIDHPTAGRLYRTGDVASTRPDGILDFHGRVDDQVKVRGFRIEPAEIEHALRSHPRVADAAVVVQYPTPDNAQLTAFVVPADGPAPEMADLRAHLASRLPAHLVPTGWQCLAELPLTAHGKLDRRALATRPVVADGTLDQQTIDELSQLSEEMGLTPIQQVVAEVWAEALNREINDPAADFLALGGHSLMALGIVEDLREDLGVELSLADFLAAQTLSGVAALVEHALRNEPELVQ